MGKFYVLVIVFASFAQFVSGSQKYEHISSCDVYNDDANSYFIIYSCGEINDGFEMFSNYYENKYNCKYKEQPSGTYQSKYISAINFKNCTFPKIKMNYFLKFQNLETFNISDVALEKIHENTFEGAGHLTHLFVSNNQLVEIPSEIFVHAPNLRTVDFSNNTIERIDPSAFKDTKSLYFLDLSYNNITELNEQVFKIIPSLAKLNLSYNQFVQLDSRILAIPSLITLDLSHNNLTKLSKHLFDGAINLKYLNLTCNPIGELKIETFIHNMDLEDLNLRRTNLSNILLGTFSHQHKLVSLDLSENQLKKLDFDLFSPILHNLQSLRLSKNQLAHLSGFRNELFPEINLLDIQGNKFNCSYLRSFMESIKWEKLHLHLDTNSVDLQRTNIRGIGCDKSVQEAIKDEHTNHTFPEEKLIDVKYLNGTSQNLHVYHSSDTTTQVLQIFMCCVMLAFFVIYVILNGGRIFEKCKTFARFNGRQSSAVHMVQFSKEEFEQAVLRFKQWEENYRNVESP